MAKPLEASFLDHAGYLLIILVITEINRVFYMPSNQFGLKNGSNREHLPHLMCNILLECDWIDKSTFVAGLVEIQAFDSSLHSQLLLSAYNRDLYKPTVLTFINLFWKLAMKIKISLPSGIKTSYPIILVQKGIRQ